MIIIIYKKVRNFGKYVWVLALEIHCKLFCDGNQLKNF